MNRMSLGQNSENCFSLLLFFCFFGSYNLFVPHIIFILHHTLSMSSVSKTTVKQRMGQPQSKEEDSNNEDDVAAPASAEATASAAGGEAKADIVAHNMSTGMPTARSTAEGTADGVVFVLDIPEDIAPPSSYCLTPTFQIENVMASEFVQWQIIELLYTSTFAACVCKAWKKIVERLIPAEILRMLLFLIQRKQIPSNAMSFLERNLNQYVHNRLSQSSVFYTKPTNLVSSCHLIRTILYNAQCQRQELLDVPPLQDDCTPACRHREAASSGGLAENGGHHEACKHQNIKTASYENIKDLYKTCVRSMVTTRLHQLDRQLEDVSNDEQLWEVLTHLDTMHQQVELMFDVRFFCFFFNIFVPLVDLDLGTLLFLFFFISFIFFLFHYYYYLFLLQSHVERHLGMCFLHLEHCLEGMSLAEVSEKIYSF